MVDLIAKSPCEGLLPLSIAATSLSEVRPGFITSLAPAPGQKTAVSTALKKSHGVGLPSPNRSLTKGDTRIIWFGPGQAMMLSPDPVAPQGAALSDQSDGWAVMRLNGPGAQAVLSRLVPLDLKEKSFAKNHAARSLLGHMTLSITRLGVDDFLILVFRSMAKTAVDEIARALNSSAAHPG